ncbi:unnamed protein product, partial [Mycena citricolor]
YLSPFMSQLRVDLPPELWLYIQRLATAYHSPLNIAYESDLVYRYDRALNPFALIRHFHEDAISFSLVSRSWNLLATELLYESICVSRFTQPSLFAALHRAGVSDLVRAVVISGPAEIHFYRALLTLCPRLEVLVLQHSNDHIMAWDIDPMIMALGHSLILPQLRFIYWNRFVAPDGLLDLVLQVSPNVQSLYDGIRGYTSGLILKESRPYAPGPISPSSLRRLEIRSIRNDLTLPLLLSLGCEHTLTRLSLPVDLLREVDFPVLPRTTVLEIFGSRRTINCPAISRLFPSLQELCFDVWNAFEGPMTLPHVAVIRLHSVVVDVLGDWHTIQRAFTLCLDRGNLPRLRRIVLYNMWDRTVESSKLAPLLLAIRQRGCDVEFPEHCVRN